MRQATEQNRVSRVEYDPSLPTYTAWDLGYRDDTAIWWYQVLRNEVHVIDFYAVSGADIDKLCKKIKGKPYHYERHFLPHDAKAKTLAAQGKSIIEQLGAQLGIENMAIVPDLGVQDGIQAVRTTLTKCWFDEERCRDGIEALRQYEREYDEDKKSFRSTPKHNWCSHPADAFRMLAVAWQNAPVSNPANAYRPLIVGPGNEATLEDMWASNKRARRTRL
jgi:hypothetical protein